VADPVNKGLGMPLGGWPGDDVVNRRATKRPVDLVAALRLSYKRMPLCDTRCCGTYVADGSLRWQRVVAPADMQYFPPLSTPPYPAGIPSSFMLNVAARKVQCSALQQPTSQLRFPFCTPACKAACCAPDLPLVFSECGSGFGWLQYTRGCAQVRTEAYEQCAQHCELPCGFQQTSRCLAEIRCAPTSFAAARGVWRMTKTRRGGPVRARRSFLA
jgi:hypothetical protein